MTKKHITITIAYDRDSALPAILEAITKSITRTAKPIARGSIIYGFDMVPMAKYDITEQGEVILTTHETRKRTDD